MNRRLKILKVFLVAMLISGCSGIFPKATAKEILILAADQEQYCESKPEKKILIEISEGNSPEYLRNQKILFKNTNELGNYQYAEWSEPLNDRVLRLVTERLRCDGFSVDSFKSNLDLEKYELDLSILDFSHSINSTPGKFRAVFRVSVIREEQQKEKLFNYEETLDSFDISGVSKAADSVIANFLNDLSSFVK